MVEGKRQTKKEEMAGKFFRLGLVLFLVFGFSSLCLGRRLSDEDLLAETQKLYSEVQDYYLRGKLKASQKVLLEILKLDPKDKIAEEFLKTVSSELKNQTERDDVFLKHYQTAKKYVHKKKWLEAKEELESAVKAWPRHSKASEAIETWDMVNQQIILQIKKKAREEADKEAKLSRKQEQELMRLKVEKDKKEKKRKKQAKKEKEKEKDSLREKDKKAKPEKPVVTLEGCIQIAVCNSLPIKIAKEQVELAEMKLFEAWRVLFPSVTGEIADTYGKTLESAYESKKRVLQFQQLIFDGGRSVFRLHQAELVQKIAQQNFNMSKQKLIFKVEQAYYRLIHFQNVIKLEKTLYEETRDFLDSTEEQYKAGYVSHLEFLNLESQFNQVGFSLVSSQQALSLAKLNFQQTLNVEVPFALEIKSKLKYASDLKIDLNRCLNLALRNRPEMRIAQLNLASSKYGEKIAERQLWPELSLVGSIGESGEAYTTDILRMKDEWSVLGKLSWSFGGSSMDYSCSREKVNPTEIHETNLTTEARTHSLKFGLLDNLDSFSKEKEAEIVFYRAMDDYNQLRQKGIMDIKETYFLYERAKIMLGAVESKIRYHQKEVKIAELRKSLDIIPLSGLLEAKIKLNAQEIAYSKALMEYHLSLAGLNRAMGISFYYGGKHL